MKNDSDHNHRDYSRFIRVSSSILEPLEKKFIDPLSKQIPSWIQTYHLTLISIFWSACLVCCGYLSQYNTLWLIGSSIFIVLHYLCDRWDGRIGRDRNTGLVRWGYYMDHFIDFLFLVSVMTGYFFLTPQNITLILFAIFSVFAAYMVNSFLISTVTDKLLITFFKIGPTEIHVLFIVMNCLIMILGTGILFPLYAVILTGGLTGLIIIVNNTQRDLWEHDMNKKMNNRTDIK